MHILKHFKTITYHKWLVMKGCFAVGLYKQGICHDLSKYSPSEFLIGARYYQGNRSPNNAEREEKGYSSAWLHHKGRNKHHYEYWIDYSLRYLPTGMAPAPMPVRYIVEMLMDRVAACKVYMKDAYTQRSPLEYYQSGKDPAPLHDKTRMMLELLLTILAQEGEKYTYHFIKTQILCRKKELDDIHNLDSVLAFCKTNIEKYS